MMEQNGYAVDYGDAYMEQEEEWEREGLLDPAWEKQQKKVTIQPFPSGFHICFLFFFFVSILLNKFLCNFKCIYSELNYKSTNSMRNMKLKC